MKLTCIICPRGCEMEVTQSNGGWTVTGNECRRGEDYAVQEASCPMRTLTTSLPITGGDYDMLSVKTAQPIPKEKIGEALKSLQDMRLSAPVQVGETVYPNIADTGIPVVATRRVRRLDK